MLHSVKARGRCKPQLAVASVTAVPSEATHCTDRVMAPPSHVLEQPLQSPRLQAYDTHRRVLHCCDSAGLVPPVHSVCAWVPFVQVTVRMRLPNTPSMPVQFLSQVLHAPAIQYLAGHVWLLHGRVTDARVAFAAVHCEVAAALPSELRHRAIRRWSPVFPPLVHGLLHLPHALYAKAYVGHGTLAQPRDSDSSVGHALPPRAGATSTSRAHVSVPPPQVTLQVALRRQGVMMQSMGPLDGVGLGVGAKVGAGVGRMTHAV